MSSFKAASEYGFVNARIRGMKSRFLKVTDYEHLLQSPDYETFLKHLSNTVYGDVIEEQHAMHDPTPDELGITLAHHFTEVIFKVAHSLSGRVAEFTNTYLNQFLAESLKSIIRGVQVGLPPEEMMMYVLPTSEEQKEMFKNLVKHNDIEDLIDAIPYLDTKVALLTRIPAYLDFDSTAPLEVALEEWYLRTVLDALDEFTKEDQEHVLDSLSARVMLRNLLTKMRALEMGLSKRIIELSMVRFTPETDAMLGQVLEAETWQEAAAAFKSLKYIRLSQLICKVYEDTNDVAEVERVIEAYLVERIKLQLTVFPFHLGTILGFFTLKSYEVRNIRSIAVGIERGVSAALIRPMLTIL